MASYDEVIDLRPITARLLGVRGDPFAFRIVVRDDAGEPVDVTLWEFAGTVTTGRLRLGFEFYPDDSGVSVFMRGDDTARLPDAGAYPYDVAARQPTAGEGSMILSGHMSCEARRTDPLRSDPDLTPADDPEAVLA